MCYEPTDENKASKPFLSDSWKALTYISPNLQELRAINRTLGNPLPAGIEHSAGSDTLLDDLDPEEEHFLLQPPFQAIWVITQWGFTSTLGVFHLTATSAWVVWPRPGRSSVKEHSRSGTAPWPKAKIPFASLHQLMRNNLCFVNKSLKRDALRAPVPTVPPFAEMKYPTTCRWKSNSIKTRKSCFRTVF